MIRMREPVGDAEKAHAARCCCREGFIVPRGGQDTVRCAACNSYCYSAPRTETGREVRSVSTVHNGIKPKTRFRIIERAGGRCQICGASGGVIHIGHLLSVEHGVAQGLTDAQINSDENLAALCEECNLGMGKQSIALWLLVAILRARTRVEAEGGVT